MAIGQVVSLAKRIAGFQRLSHVLVTAFFLPLLMGSAGLPTTDRVIGEVQSRYNAVRTLQVDFVESYSLLGHPRPPESGTLTLRKQGKMRWDYSRPKGKLFVSDGKTVYLYTATDNRVEKVPLKDTEDMRAPLAFLLGRLDLRREFINFQLKTGDGGSWLIADAKNERVPYKSIEMLVDGVGSIKTLKVLGRDESVLTYGFTDERINPPVDDRAFRFTIPPGAEVIDALQVDARGR